jgi:SAM-dependent methyltransferase
MPDTIAMPVPRAAADSTLGGFIREHVADQWYSWAMSNYKEMVMALATNFDCRNVLEIGGGRSPLLSKDQLAQARLDCTVNDVSEAELRQCPAWAGKLCFDIAGDDTPQAQFDLIFSRMLQEHVSSAGKCYGNIFRLLRPGGIALNFHPTLYAPPFAVNYLIPSRLSAAILHIFGARLTDAEEPYPKFPARYSWCRASARIAGKLRTIGFSEIFIVPFYGHGYFRKIPVLRDIDDWFAKMAKARGASFLSSYAYTIVRK